MLAFGGASALDAEARKRGRHGNDRRKDRDAGDGGATTEGPCGNGKRKANICTKDSQCCTGWCDTRKAKTNNDKKGRCRCVQRGGDCSKGQTCCNTLTCDGKVCGRDKKETKVPTAARCSAGATCANPDAVCTAYTGAGAPEGTYCTLPLGMSCTGDPECTCYSCGVANPETGGAESRAARADLVCCGKEGLACVKDRNCCQGWKCLGSICTDCIPNVCANGCDYTTVQAAITAMEGTADSLIMLAAGEYVEDLTISKSVTIRGCGAVTLKNATAGRRTIVLPTSKPATAADYPTVELKNVTVTTDTVAPDYGGGIGGNLTSGADGGGYANLILSGATVVTGSRIKNRGGGIHLTNGSSVLLKDDAEVSGNASIDAGAGGIYVEFSKIVMTDRSAVRNNTSGGAGDGGGIHNYYGVTEMSGSATVAGNTSDGPGAGMYLYVDSYDVQISFDGSPVLSMKDQASIVDNTAFADNTSDETSVSSGSGGGVYVGGACEYNGVSPTQRCTTVTLSGEATISGNKAGPGPGKSGFGGGIGAQATDIILSDNASIDGNSAWATASSSTGPAVTGQQAMLWYIPTFFRPPVVTKGGTSTVGVECKIYTSVTAATTDC